MNTAVKIGDRLVGEGHPPYIIAEACVNHQGDIEIAKRMVYFAHAMGADAIKFPDAHSGRRDAARSPDVR